MTQRPALLFSDILAVADVSTVFGLLEGLLLSGPWESSRRAWKLWEPSREGGVGLTAWEAPAALCQSVA